MSFKSSVWRLLVVLACCGCASSAPLRLYEGPVRPAAEVATIVHMDQNGRRQKSKLEIAGIRTEAAEVLPGLHVVDVHLTKRRLYFSGDTGVVTLGEAAAGLAVGADNYNMKKRLLTRQVSVQAQAGRTYFVSARWLNSDDKNDPLWNDRFRGDRIRVWVTEEGSPRVVASSPECDSEVPLPGLSESPRCWFVPDK